ncbi:MAG: serine/threonine-protein kinase, partial [Planctomycetota bacterium]
MTGPTAEAEQEDRRSRARAVVDRLLRERGDGADLDERSVCAAHPELAAELRSELRKARVIGRARHVYESRGNGGGPAPAVAVGGDSFPGYELTGELHRGGQGVVYRAIQTGTKREVAIKALRGGAFSASRDRARFEREVEILGQLKHPNIVTVHDSGTAAGGTYFVMDFIAGRPLDEHVADARAGVDEVMRLFAEICEAVNVAHLRGVIHRDLKPSNIRVDENGTPFILDFGLAKIDEASEGLASAPTMTVPGQFVGSLPWASPEQAEDDASGHALDVRSDVYSLGVILYQLLTGEFPYDVGGGVRTVFENITAAEPVPPRTLRTDINDEVETIVLKCLHKEPERRYQSAGELARDVRRYLAGEAIEAKRDSTWYVLTKTVRRYRVPLSVAAAFLVLLTVFAVTMAFQYRRATAAERLADRRAEESLLVLAGLTDVFSEGQSEHVGHREILGPGAERVVERYADQPRVQVALMESIASIADGLALPDVVVTWRERVVEHRSRVLGDDALTIAESRQQLAEAIAWAGDRVRAAEILTDVLAQRRRVLGDEHALVAQTM